MQSLPDVPVRLVVLGTLAVSLCIIVVLAIVSLVSAGDPRETSPAAVARTHLTPLEQIIGPLQLHHFYIPNPEREVMELQISPFRDPSLPWSEEEVQIFWLDPLKLGLEEVEKKNRTMIEELYATIP
ncbi:hypothetical protein [Spirochaeta africana]|uniref:Uncharacterized protein n=1 Tax=Spirochaeta africana (strain ATCC 700263 / DSM 8902 / Z-7692) TaxID=889378 RepID=H9UIE3_SPIAZ|nr:hypothetical protein [Spirochaeta africana]AFG37286.1 hypothetical protein Spiaf_1208 [Spirochaeta africana DSM 8902]